MPAFDLYGFTGGDLEVARDVVDKALGLTLQPHESSLHGGDYYRQGNLDTEHFVLQRNLDILDNMPAEEDFSSYPILLYVEETNRSTEIAQCLLALSGVKLLRHEDM